MLVRSYSRNSGSTRLEMDMKGCPGSFCRASSTISSWTGFRKENRNDTATESTWACSISAARVSTDWGVRSSMIVPVWSTRSATPNLSSQGDRAGGRSRLRLYSSDRACRPISRTSSNPRVVTRAVRLPLPSNKALVATVEP